MILAVAPGGEGIDFIQVKSHPKPVGWYLGQYIDRCIVGTGEI